ncbi:MAG: hypothetical protein U9O86_02370 [Campylobacterota bacterium]|nr:hypothetical protein [Campylobacterota bacterium]
MLSIEFLGLSEYASIHITVFILNALLFILSSKIVKFLNSDQENTKQLSLFRSLNLAFFFFHFLDWVMLFLNQNYENYFFKMGLSIVLIYSGIIFYSLATLYTKAKFGISKDVDDAKIYYDSYSSRMVNLLLLVVISLMILMYIIKIWGFTSLLETTGLFGLVIAFLALTNSIWAPDLYYGMVILNSKMLEDGDVISFSHGEHHLYIISKVTFIYTILLDVTNNHRIMIRNAKMVDATINNLSKKASLEGLREYHIFKIGYPQRGEDAELSYKEHKKKIDIMFKEVQEKAFEDEKVLVNENVEFTWYVKETADYAIEYVLTYHLSSLPATRSTKRIREYLLATPRLINEISLEASYKYDVDLSTPLLHQKID